jgi:hypothetical protein
MGARAVPSEDRDPVFIAAFGEVFMSEGRRPPITPANRADA